MFNEMGGIFMKRKNSLTLLVAALFMLGPTTVFAGACSNEVKLALSHPKWKLTTEFSSGA